MLRYRTYARLQLKQSDVSAHLQGRTHTHTHTSQAHTLLFTVPRPITVTLPCLQRNLRRDKDRRNLTQFNMQTLPKSAKQKER